MIMKLLRYNKEPIELEVDKIDRISGISQSNLIVVMTNGESHIGYMIDNK